MRSEPLPAGIVAHLDRCSFCQDEATQIRRTVATLRMAGSPEPVADARRQSDRPVIVGRRQSARRVLAGVTMVIVLLMVPGALLSAEHRDETVAIKKMGPMVEQPWGTEIEVSVSGLVPGRPYRLMTVDADGDRVVAGSIEVAERRPVRARLVSAQRRHDITSLQVEGRRGEVIAVLGAVPRLTLRVQRSGAAAWTAGVLELTVPPGPDRSARLVLKKALAIDGAICPVRV